jgi:hypothetical protein
MTIIINILTTIGLKLLTSTVIENLLVIGAETLAKRTTSDVDDKAVAIIKEALGKKAE